MPNTQWKLKEYLQEHNIKAWAIVEEAEKLGYNLGGSNIYRLTTDDGPANVNRKTLTALIAALRSLTKRKVKVSDLLEYNEDSND